MNEDDFIKILRVCGVDLSNGPKAIQRMVDRFLTWPLPKSVASDLCVTEPNYPHLRTPTAWVRKAIAESEQGKKVVFVFPVYKWILMLLTHPNLKEVRNLKDVKWCAIEDGSPGKGMGQHIAMFVLDSSTKSNSEEK